MTEIDETTRAAIATRLAATQQITETSARAMVDDVCERWHDSPYVAVVWPVVGGILRPIIDAMAAVDPASPEGVAMVVTVAKAAFPEAFGGEERPKLS